MDAEEVAFHKSALRRHVVALRDKLSESERTAGSAIICGKLQRRLEQLIADRRVLHRDKPRTVISYLPFRSEVDVLPMLEWCRERAIPVAAPRTIPAEHSMVMHYINGSDDTIMGHYGISEPRSELPVVDDPAQIGAVIVPGTAFDDRGNRLGYGGGYYDRYFEALADRCGKLPLLIAPCFELQLVPHIPVSRHDVKMDWIITEKREIGLTAASSK